MSQPRIVNGSSSSRKQQTAVKHTVDRPKSKSWYSGNGHHRNQPYPLPTTFNPESTVENDIWPKVPLRIFDGTPELELSCQEEMLSEVQLQNYPMQARTAFDPAAPLPLPAVRKRTSVIKKLTTQEIDILDDPDEDFVPSGSDEDDDDDENYLPEHDRRPYNRGAGLTSGVGRGRGGARGGRGNAHATAVRLPPSTHFVRPQPDTSSHSSSQLFSSSRYSSSTTGVNRRRDTDSLEIELERTYAAALPRYYGTRAGQAIDPADYGDFRIKCSICGDQSSNNISFIAHLCSHFEDDLNYISPFDKVCRTCSVCQENFSTPFATLLHEDQEHMIELNEFRCRICHQNHHTLIDLFAHLNYAHGGLDMPYYCDCCGYRTSMYDDMAYHIRQIHKGTQYFFCPYCFQSVQLQSMSYSNVLNSTPAFRHVILHFDRIENSQNKHVQQQQRRRIESKFYFCNRCSLHVKSLKEHQTHHHHARMQFDEQQQERSFIPEDNHHLKGNNSIFHQTNDVFDQRSYPSKFDRSKQLPMATIRRRQTAPNTYDETHLNNRWHSRR